MIPPILQEMLTQYQAHYKGISHLTCTSDQLIDFYILGKLAL